MRYIQTINYNVSAMSWPETVSDVLTHEGSFPTFQTAWDRPGALPEPPALRFGNVDEQ